MAIGPACTNSHTIVIDLARVRPGAILEGCLSKTEFLPGTCPMSNGAHLAVANFNTYAKYPALRGSAPKRGPAACHLHLAREDRAGPHTRAGRTLRSACAMPAPRRLRIGAPLWPEGPPWQSTKSPGTGPLPQPTALKNFIVCITRWRCQYTPGPYSPGVSPGAPSAGARSRPTGTGARGLWHLAPVHLFH